MIVLITSDAQYTLLEEAKKGAKPVKQKGSSDQEEEHGLVPLPAMMGATATVPTMAKTS